MSQCDHEFVDSNYCLKCGWAPAEQEARAMNDRDQFDEQASTVAVALLGTICPRPMFSAPESFAAITKVVATALRSTASEAERRGELRGLEWVSELGMSVLPHPLRDVIGAPHRRAQERRQLMAKLEKHQAFRSKKSGNGEVILVKGGARGRNLYLWVQGSADLPDRIAIVPGAATLKRLALAILRECRRSK